MIRLIQIILVVILAGIVQILWKHESRAGQDRIVFATGATCGIAFAYGLIFMGKSDALICGIIAGTAGFLLVIMLERSVW